MYDLIDKLGDQGFLALAGLVTGLVYGLAAEQSKFCLRAAAVDVARLRAGPRFATWLLAFSTALLWTQTLNLTGVIDLGESRWLATPGTLAGAVIGGVLFGVGMVLARGCPGRLLVLGATGNLRAILSGLVFAVAAQMTLYGALAPLRATISSAWTTTGPNPNLLQFIPVSGFGIVIALVFAAAALAVAYRNRVAISTLVFGCGVGFAVALGWFLTSTASRISFEPVSPSSITFSGPSADMLMFLLSSNPVLDFNIGLITGVFIAAFMSAAASKRLGWQGWDGVQSMQRYLSGAALMGFGAMTAGGCTIGAGVTGGSTFALTAWVALFSMWMGGMITDRLVDQPGEAILERV